MIKERDKRRRLPWEKLLKETGKNSCYFEVSLGDRYDEVPKEVVEKTFKFLDELVASKFTT